MSRQERISIAPEIRSGKPCIRGARITVYDILEYLPGGMTEAELLEDFPDFSRGKHPHLPRVRGRERTKTRLFRRVKLLFDENLSPKLGEEV